MVRPTYGLPKDEQLLAVIGRIALSHAQLDNALADCIRATILDFAKRNFSLCLLRRPWAARPKRKKEQRPSACGGSSTSPLEAISDGSVPAYSMCNRADFVA